MSVLHQPALFSFNVDQFHRMMMLGILREGEPVELIDGLLVRKDRADRGGDPMSHGPRHSLTIKRVQREFRDVEAAGFHLHCQLPVTLSDVQEPEPDVSVVRGRPEDYRQRHPRPADILAIFEVADSSLSYDRTTKQRLFAEAQISLYWIINLADQQIEVYQQPSAAEGRYLSRTEFRPGQSVQLAVTDSLILEVPVTDVIPQ